MSIRLRIATLLAGVLVATPLLAQQQAASAEALAQALQKGYDGVHDFRASFVQTIRGGPLRIESKAEGTVAVKKPGKMRWDYTKPDRQTIVSDGVRVYDYDYASKETNVMDVPAGDQAPTATLFLAGRGNILRDFKVSNAQSPVPGTQALRLDPRKADPDYEYLVVLFEPKSFQIRGLMSRDAVGVDSTIVFSNIRQNTNVADKTFAFTPPAK